MTYFRTDLRPSERFNLSPSDAPSDLEQAYTKMQRLVAQAPSQWVGWKLGGSNHATQKAFGVEVPYFGPLHESEIFHTPHFAPLIPLCEIKGEVEIALRISADMRTYDAWTIALEMPASALLNLPGAGVAALIADRCGAGALLLGPIQTTELPDFSGIPFRLLKNDLCLSQAGIDALTGTPQQILQQFLDIATEHGFNPQPGDWVATGGITSCCDFSEGDRIRVCLKTETILDFIVGFKKDE